MEINTVVLSIEKYDQMVEAARKFEQLFKDLEAAKVVILANAKKIADLEKELESEQGLRSFWYQEAQKLKAEKRQSDLEAILTQAEKRAEVQANVGAAGEDFNEDGRLRPVKKAEVQAND